MKLKKFPLLILMALSSITSCDKKSQPEPVVIPTSPPSTATPKTEYLPLRSETAHSITVTKMSGDYHYSLETTDHDPYISTGKLAKANPGDSVVFCFEYKSNKELDFIQIFFADPITEMRSMKTGKIPASNAWKEWSITLKKQLAEHSWGNAGNYLRLDFGNDAGYKIELRNMHFRGMTPEEIRQEEERDAKIEADKKFGENIRKYLDSPFTSFITEVDAGTNSITVKGNYIGEGDFALCEIPPYLDVIQPSDFTLNRPLSTPSFSETFDRYVDRDGFNYDRTLSKWVIVKKSAAGGNYDMAVSHAHYPDNIYATRTTTAQKPAGKIGLGGYINHSIQRQDLDELGITSVTVNVPVTAYMRSRQEANSIEHRYGGKSYYFAKNHIDALDASLKECAQRNIVVAAIVLIQPAASCSDKEIGNLLQHPDFAGGFYTMPNMTTPESVNTYAAALDFLANRYCRSDGQYGRIHHWIMHNEVDMGTEWTNMGFNKPMLTYTDAYMKSMRMCYNIARQYDRYSEVFGSFTHSWTRAETGDGYPTLDMLHAFNDYCRTEGDFQWALAYHCYPQDLNEPKTWNDALATYSTATAQITFKNLEVLNHWAKQSENHYQGNIKRNVWLSENGTNSRTYSETDLREQAAGFAWGWKKLKDLDGIDAMQWHNWADNEAEFGLRIGLRKFGSQPYNLEAKEVWYVYQAAETANEDAVFQKYLSVIGIPNWNIIRTIN